MTMVGVGGYGGAAAKLVHDLSCETFSFLNVRFSPSLRPTALNLPNLKMNQ